MFWRNDIQRYYSVIQFLFNTKKYNYPDSAIFTENNILDVSYT